MTTAFRDTLPSELVTHVTEMCGARGEVWFAELPQIISGLENKWKIRAGMPLQGIEYNFVAEARTEDEVPVVLKIAPPFETTEIHGEAKFLRSRNGNGCVRLLAEERQQKAILLERALPGRALHEEFADQPMDCVDPGIDALKRILQPPPTDMADVPTLDGWFDNFGRRYHDSAFPAELAQKALEIYSRLRGDRAKLAYIHGDFHPGNIVTGTRERFQVIDPKGIVGHVGYDVAVFLINLERWQRNNIDLAFLLERAIARFAAAFNMTAREIREWVFAHMVIGAWWNFEDMPSLYDPEVAMPAIWHL